jgi:hypothetical protein
MCVLAGLIVGVVRLMPGRDVQQASRTADSLCYDLKTQSYFQAFMLLSASLQQNIPAETFIGLERSADAHFGVVRDCGHVTNVTIQKSQATLEMQITRSAQTSGRLLLVRQTGYWRVDAVAGELQVI